MSRVVPGTGSVDLHRWEYAAGEGYEHSSINQEIFNFKKPMSERNRPGWRYKASAIRKIATAFMA